MLYVALQEGTEHRPNRKNKNSACDLTIDVPDLVAHGKPDELIIGVIHDKNLVHTEHLGRFNFSWRLIILAALEGDGLTPLVRPGLSGAVRKANYIVSGGGWGDHWEAQ